MFRRIPTSWPWRFMALFVGAWLLWRLAAMSQNIGLVPQAVERDGEYAGSNRELQGSYKERQLGAAAASLERKVELQRAAATPEDLAGSLATLAQIRLELSDFDAARKALDEVLAIRRQLNGEDHWQTADARLALTNVRILQQLDATQRARLAEAASTNRKALQFYREARFADAIRLAEEGLAIHRQILGENHDSTALCINNLAQYYQGSGIYARAQPLFEKALLIRKELHGESHPETAACLNNLGMLCQYQGEYARALPLLERALAIRVQTLGEDHPDTSISFNNLGLIYDLQGDYPRALPLYERALAIRRRAFGDNHLATATSLNNVGMLLKFQGEYARALPLLQQALEIRKNVLGENHPDTAMILDNVGLLYGEQGDFTQAKVRLEQALAIRKDALGENHPDTTTSINNLALLYKHQGDYVRALPLYEQALAIRRRALGENHPATAMSYNNLAKIFEAQGDYTRALPLCEQALSIRKQALGETHPETAMSLNNLAMLHHSNKDYARAASLYEEALAIQKQRFGADHPETAVTINNLAMLYFDQGDYVRARPLLDQALAIRKKSWGEEHPDVANSLNNLSTLYRYTRDFSRALPRAEQALAISKRLLGNDHPYTSGMLNNLAMIYQAQGDYSHALPMLQQATKIALENLNLSAAIQSEQQQLIYLNHARGQLDNFISCALLGRQYEGQAYEQLLAWKGIVMKRQLQMRLARAGKDADEQALWDDLQRVAARLAALSLNVPSAGGIDAWQMQCAELTEHKQRLEAKLGQRSAHFGELQSKSNVTVDQLRSALPTDVALVDLLEVWRPLEKPTSAAPPNECFERRVAAFVVWRDRPLVVVDLGLAEPIETAVEAWRAAIDANRGGSAETIADGQGTPQQNLRRLAWEPLEPHLGDARLVLISPDGVLTKAPLAALPGKRPGAYLLEERALVCLPVPQLLPLLLNQNTDREALDSSLLLVGGVDFGASPGEMADGALLANAGPPRRSPPRDGPLYFGPIPETRAEVDAIAQLWRTSHAAQPSAVLADAQPTEAALREQMPRHQFLHLATHGYFSSPSVKSALAGSDGASLISRSETVDRVTDFHPGLLSGLALAGANRRAEHSPELGEQTDDGVLTALEVAALDLSHVDLVVLSACETGLGKVAGGEGVLGLQRAFQSAGARTTVTSLWKVSDEATRTLMTEFYTNLWQKKVSRIEALRQAQLAMLNNYDRRTGELSRAPGENVPINASAERTTADAAGRTPPAVWAAFSLAGDWR